MSSHHIVREKQEPALVIIDLSEFSDEHLGHLLEWAPTVLVSENVYDEIYSRGIKVDYLITDNDFFEVQEHTLIIPANDDFSASAMAFLINKGFPSVNILTNHFNFDLHFASIDKIDQVIFSGGLRIFSIRSGFRKWKEKDEKIHFYSIPNRLSATGLEQISELVYKTVKDGFYSVEFDEVAIFIAEEY